ncbi:Hypothetical predicted protein [Mytilus galloprovincialis]|uniref:Uncharacterized protein n=1 Tax=Mytilus galloprovincialis TaxID=29158 RepID=A0A8B6G7Y4_MYTGA|nr:Hypothetical predicted protein [Mytilus galloprovincialis]
MADNNMLLYYTYDISIKMAMADNKQKIHWLCDPCICTNQTQTQNYTYTEWREILASQLEQIKDNMKLDKKRLSSSIRKRTCASDYRPSAERLGIIGAGVIVVEICIIIFDDLLTLVMRLKHLV